MKYLVTIVAGALVIFGSFYLLSSQGDAPSVNSGAEMAAENVGEPLAEVKIPENLSAQALIGQRAFDAKCASCHGANAAGQAGVAPPLVHDIYRSGHHGDAAFLVAARNGVRSHHWRFGNMPPVDGITDAELKSIVRYVRELQKANGID